MRYLGGLLGGTWLTALAGDLGARHLRRRQPGRQLRDRSIPANTYWDKPYNVYSKVDTEADALPRLRDLVGQPGAAQRREMQWIADNLFVGNKLAAGELRTSRRACGSTCATSSRRSSCSAPGATTSRRRSRRSAGSPTSTSDEAEIVAQRPDHRLHAAPVDRPSRHLRLRQGRDQGARRVRRRCMDMIDLLPPGLYEAVISEVERGHRQRRPHRRQVPVPPGAAHARRHPRARRQQPRGRAALRRRRPGLGDQPAASTAPLSRRWSRGDDDRASAEAMRAAASEPAALRRCSPTRTR